MDKIEAIINPGEKTSPEASRLERSINIGRNCLAEHSGPGFSIKFEDSSVSVRIGIGKDHTAYFVMSKEAWVAFMSGQQLSMEKFTDYLDNIRNGVNA